MGRILNVSFNNICIEKTIYTSFLKSTLLKISHVTIYMAIKYHM